jgi:hypothetical protein
MTTLSLPPERLMGQGTRASARGEAVPVWSGGKWVRPKQQARYPSSGASTRQYGEEPCRSMPPLSVLPATS